LAPETVAATQNFVSMPTAFLHILHEHATFPLRLAHYVSSGWMKSAYGYVHLSRWQFT